MLHGGKRGTVAAHVVALLTVAVVSGLLALVATTTPASAAPRQHRTTIADVVACQGDPATTSSATVLLVPGTGLSASEDWVTTYEPQLVARGHAVCTVDLPDYATGDVQVSAAYVAQAIRYVHAMAGAPIDVIGHSQGGFLPRLALKVWPDLTPMVDDVIGLAGVYDGGSAALVDRCDPDCVPALHQLAAGSHLLHAVRRLPLPAGPSYTNIGTAGDTTVTPQPTANAEKGATAIELQDVCPGRTIPLSEHALIVGDAVALALALDALDHTGPADPSRIDPLTCDEVYYAGFVPDPYLAAAPLAKQRLTDTVPVEPPVRCFLRPTCTDADARGRMVESSRAAVDHDSVTWHATLSRPGHVRLEIPGRTVVRAVDAGRVTIRVPVADGRRAPRALQIETRPRYFTAYADEGSDKVA